ncbi:hypothetical protein AcW1_007936 [Taiwanofungus camphoratus]|nr:hypothetical protein AcW1_007936 [Antrodia cinnamomea]
MHITSLQSDIAIRSGCTQPRATQACTSTVPFAGKSRSSSVKTGECRLLYLGRLDTLGGAYGLRAISARAYRGQQPPAVFSGQSAEPPKGACEGFLASPAAGVSQ